MSFIRKNRLSCEMTGWLSDSQMNQCCQHLQKGCRHMQLAIIRNGVQQIIDSTSLVEENCLRWKLSQQANGFLFDPETICHGQTVTIREFFPPMVSNRPLQRSGAGARPAAES